MSIFFLFNTYWVLLHCSTKSHDDVDDLMNKNDEIRNVADIKCIQIGNYWPQRCIRMIIKSSDYSLFPAPMLNYALWITRNFHVSIEMTKAKRHITNELKWYDNIQITHSTYVIRMNLFQPKTSNDILVQVEHLIITQSTTKKIVHSDRSTTMCLMAIFWFGSFIILSALKIL